MISHFHLSEVIGKCQNWHSRSVSFPTSRMLMFWHRLVHGKQGKLAASIMYLFLFFHCIKVEFTLYHGLEGLKIFLIDYGFLICVIVKHKIWNYRVKEVK